MQCFTVLASLVFELAGGQNDSPLSLRYKKHLSPLRVNCRLFNQTTVIYYFRIHGPLNYQLVYFAERKINR